MSRLPHSQPLCVLISIDLLLCASAACTNLQQQAGANPFTCESVPHGGFCPGECSTFYTGTVNATCSLGTVTYDNQCTCKCCSGCGGVVVCV